MGSILSGILGTNNNFQGNNTYHVDDPYTQGQSQGAYRQADTTFNGENTLAQALTAQSQGQGPNPALDQLRMTTDQNNRMAAGLAASQRGLNPALAAQMALNAQATNNQQAAGQAAIMRGQQQLAAQGQLGGLYGQMGQQGIGQQQVINNANQGANSINAGVAKQNTDIDAGAASQNAGTAGKIVGGLASGAGALLGLARGGLVPGSAPTPGDSYSNDTVPTMLSPGEIVIPRSQAQDPDRAKAFVDALMDEKKFQSAKKVPASYGEVLAAHREHEQRIAALEKKAGKKK